MGPYLSLYPESTNITSFECQPPPPPASCWWTAPWPSPGSDSCPSGDSSIDKRVAIRDTEDHEDEYLKHFHVASEVIVE